ncbi:biotin-dependent carboxyltransferase family protein [Falsirhodobacter sp. 20TX0035]|uniref:5-oxoprolinase subunit C family protein n=1 Tax=Falsirhodobacter sp. 20TX0035 TaxID=3022019 RepID=UPI00233090E6|nr:biotin-dependent carboxyltransferase family protein [Falsirhodobacter sp. 20TX0035]MDB6454214.1 biotin-dependent carboxyltransferase family protein [Falsirhodobacter sp. 20TX0035]
MLEVLRAGPMLTVQDRGRFGWRHAGVSAAGPMDGPAFAMANALVGNTAEAAALEFAHLGGIFRAHAPCRIAVTGGTAEVVIEGEPRPAWEAHRVMAGQTIRIGAMADAVWGYLAVSGGIETPILMGSRAAHLRSGLGRVVEAGARLPLGAFDPRGPALACRRPHAETLAPRDIRVVLGPQQDAFSAEVLERFASARFTVTTRRDRMAMILDGPQIPAQRGHDIVSDGTVAGSIQIPGSGCPIVLMAEAQTTGGYPKIATVIGADLPRLAQMPSGAAFRFRPVPRDTAEDIWIAQHSAERRARLRLSVTIARRWRA